MFRKLVLALAVGWVLTGSAWAQIGGDAVKHAPNKIARKGPITLGAKGPKASVKGLCSPRDAQTGQKIVNPANSQKGNIAVLIGRAKQPTPTGSAPAVKLAVPRQLPPKVFLQDDTTDYLFLLYGK